VEDQDRMIDAWQQGQELTFAGGERKGTKESGTASIPSPSPQEIGSPAGLESVWGTLTTDEKASAMRMLARGVTAPQIVAALQGGQ
jgi:hypothetical protein